MNDAEATQLNAHLKSIATTLAQISATLAQRAIILTRGVVGYDAPMTADIAARYFEITGTASAR